MGNPIALTVVKEQYWIKKPLAVESKAIALTASGVKAEAVKKRYGCWIQDLDAGKKQKISKNFA